METKGSRLRVVAHCTIRLDVERLRPARVQRRGRQPAVGARSPVARHRDHALRPRDEREERVFRELPVEIEPRLPRVGATV